ncbi:polysaccharide lyase family 7 protein [Flagellimonas sp. DF-77]|uniref:polysaccharide lyase family 7 protein n=1 Tax=Flagellimonas algarum TaxID=3230298 RepID=UPI0033908F0A
MERKSTTLSIVLILLLFAACQKNEKPTIDVPDVGTIDEVLPPLDEEGETTDDEASFVLPEIDLSNWKVTLPVGVNGKPTEVEPPEILDYATSETLLPFMYNDSTDGSLVFYTYPGVTTPNSSRSRTELREQLVPGSNNTNWTFAQGGSLFGELAMAEISTDADGEYHRTIIMQIHGRLTDAQRDLIGEDDNNAPPILKIYWQNGRVRVKTKILKDPGATGNEILYTDAWTDDDGHYFDETVGFDKFTLEVKVSEGRMEVILNNGESVVYDDVNIQKWEVFENYFKAGNYLQTTDEGSFAKVKLYRLEVGH